jgi:hypothetical protein
MLSHEEIRELMNKVEKALSDSRPITPPWAASVQEVEEGEQK